MADQTRIALWRLALAIFVLVLWIGFLALVALQVIS
jgi:hypothetical protein